MGREQECRLTAVCKILHCNRFVIKIKAVVIYCDWRTMAGFFKPPLAAIAWLAISAAPLLYGATPAETLRARIEANWQSPAALCRIGDALYRLADFSGAAIAYRGALEADPNAARAWLGLGRLEQIRFRRRTARDLVAKACRLAPRDPEVVLAYSDYAPEPQARGVLLRKVVALARDSNPAQAAAALARLQLDERLAGKPDAALASPYRAYFQELAPFRSGPATEGMLIGVRLNGGAPLRLVLDSGPPAS
jgi:tetratricopeptide (TPR) repeat protein